MLFIYFKILISQNIWIILILHMEQPTLKRYTVVFKFKNCCLKNNNNHPTNQQTKAIVSLNLALNSCQMCL